ncbi:phage tail tape measure protein [Phaeovulum vinaykumarii]|uniref:Phage tail tape measure protein, lambda family n=1 Tax=Phaeovulum vinaykumarii TaxID=407234 RepID=A0A1N7K6Z5_9RHOB|nr:hypothetical protein [Phaeovulum vinaykumarii]SIS57204.1 phage tail tape measure protein, lambda family [Phaeovulum vinaykumarii]SOB93315.1 lambda family phage tail tape measure protein [Phaeovulum vinaykumarii]
MNDVTLPGLIVPVEARIDKLEKALKRASGAQARTARDMETRARQSVDRMARSYDGLGARMAGAFKSVPIPGLGVGMAGLAGAGFGAGFGLAAGQVRATVRSIAEIGNEARRAGVAVEDFQRWQYVAEQNRVSLEALTDGFKELSLRADEFVITGKGAGAEAFQRLGFSADVLAAHLKDPSALMLEIVKRLERLDTAAQIRVADEIFGGTGGERFVEMLARGEAGISAMMGRASVLTEEQIERADDLDRRYSALTASLHRGWQHAALGAADFVAQVLNIQTETGKLAASDLFRNRMQAPQILGPEVDDALKDNGQAVADNAQAIADLLTLYERFGAQADALAPILSRFGGELTRMGETEAGHSLQDAALSMQTLTGKLDAGEISAQDFERQMGQLIEKAQAAFGALGDLDDVRFARVIERLGDLWSALEALRSKAAQARATLPGGVASREDTRGAAIAEARSGSYANSSPYAPMTSPPPKPAPPLVDETGHATRRGGGGTSTDVFARAVADLAREKAALDAEAAALVAAAAAGRDYTDAVDFARTRAELLTAAEREGKTITPELSAQVDQLAQSYVEAGNRAEAAANKLKRIDAAGQRGAETLTDLFTGVLEGSMSAEEALEQLVLKLAEVQFQQALTGLFSGPLGGFGAGLGGLLGFAAGGYTGDGGKFEPAGIVHRGEFVMSKAATARLGAGNLEALHQAALRGYSGGGLVGARAPGATRERGSASAAPGITINAPVTVNATGGTPEANADLARQVADQTERAMRAIVTEELLRQMRPGGVMR